MQKFEAGAKGEVSCLSRKWSEALIVKPLLYSLAYHFLSGLARFQPRFGSVNAG